MSVNTDMGWRWINKKGESCSPATHGIVHPNFLFAEKGPVKIDVSATNAFFAI
jgi:hypothetical protein